MSGLTRKITEVVQKAEDFLKAGLSFTLNLHHGTKMSVAGFPLPAGVSVASSNPKVCAVSVSNGVVSLSAPEKGEAVLTASMAGFSVPGQVTVKVW